ncbi:cation efflux system protein [Actinorhabdospora filicis]|uniref:Cation efflux system protein n=1 Tax=Actinorhabdospora filicis TaxID=1785913 RepID=A0A9W6WD37_9ACTN|nr:cation diffusion facilitator family transporter [Actinorhabdospora filicis]GLZ81713.1 cation efflux system protein [Actinorhabdospora filicis]
MGAGHDHGAKSLGDAHRTRLLAAFVITTGFMVLEVAGGVLTGSLALISDAAHMFTDALGIGMALAAIFAIRRADGARHRTFGLYRLEVLAALANAALLFGVAIWVLVEAVRRFGDPPEVLTGPLMIVAVAGLIANIASFLLLRDGAKESINVRGAYLEVLGDMLGSIGVIGAALIIQLTGWWYADPIMAVAIGVFILPRTWRLGRDALRILLQSAPAGMDVEAVRGSLHGVPGVEDVHDLHVWTLTSGMDVASVHLSINAGADLGDVLNEARQALHDGYGIHHATLQVEPAGSARDCETLSW